VKVRNLTGNPEGLARHSRYRALGDIAQGLEFLATAHHADDQLETILMRLMRGAGPRGLAGVRPSRLLPGFPIRVIRPMLHVTGEDSERICQIAGYEWRTDATNNDTTRLRAALRADIIPRLKRLAPSLPSRARATAELLADAAELIDGHAAKLLAKATPLEGGGCTWERPALRAEPPLVIGTALRLAGATLTGDVGLDRLAWRLVRPAVLAITSSQTDPRRFEWRGMNLLVTAHRVEVRPSGA
jgi:tRNA(Ile)-lysidine synthase